MMLVSLVLQDMREGLLNMNRAYKVIKEMGELFDENSFLCIDEDTQDAILIDPSTEKFTKIIDEQNLTLRAILITHAHIDHIFAVDYYSQKYDVPVYLHKDEKRKLKNPELNLSSQMYEPFYVESDALAINEREGIIELPSFAIEYELMPGHSEGNLQFHLLDSNIYFIGDVAFKDSIGRFDLPGSNARAHYDSLMKVGKLPSDAIIYSGHGSKFTVDDLEQNAVYQQFIQSGM